MSAHKKPVNIAIDGPAGAGKSTVARLLAQRLNVLYLDTGAMYRAIGLKAIVNGLNVHSEEQLSAMLARTSLEVSLNRQGQRVLLDGVDVTDEIRSPQVSRAASDVSSVTAVRHHLVEMQRQMARHNDLVLDGRDIGTYVLPKATFKFFLIADLKERARRRLNDLVAQGVKEQTLNSVMEEVLYRDRQDSQRTMAPLKQAGDAILIDTSNMTVEEVIERMLEVVRSNQNE